MASDETERLLNEIGQRLAEEAGHPPTSILLCADLDTNVVGYGIFIEYSNHIGFTWAGESLTDPLLDLWEEEDAGKRWAEMDYVFSNGKFAVTFVYPGEFDADEDYLDRRQRVIARHFGDKPVIYPPMPDDDGEQFDL